MYCHLFLWLRVYIYTAIYVMLDYKRHFYKLKMQQNHLRLGLVFLHISLGSLQHSRRLSSCFLGKDRLLQQQLYGPITVTIAPIRLIQHVRIP